MYKSLPIRPKKLFFLCFMAVVLGILATFIAKALLLSISLITNIAYFHKISFEEIELINLEPSLLNIFIPIIGGIIVGFMARYGSSGIRGHGIPEVMETILIKESRIPRRITLLKPLSAAIAIGTGGPFGAEDPIIATGSSIGSWIGRHFVFNEQERKILLATGAAAGMTAIFGTPLAAIFICIELLLFEFSLKSFIPVAISVSIAQIIRHATGHTEVFFPLENTQSTITFLNSLYYCLSGAIVGIAATLASKFIFKLEDLFEKLKCHWMWWPAIGGIFIGVIGYIEPRSLGVGYVNITEALQGELLVTTAFSILVWKFLSWAIALSSGTSGGTLAPLLTLGSTLGLLIAYLGQYLFPSIPISTTTMALIGMSCMFSGATRAILTSTIFAVEISGIFTDLTPLLLANSAAYFISSIMLKETIMTEKISKRGVSVPFEYFSVKQTKE